MQLVLKDAQAANPDVLLAFSYPPDTFAITDTAKVLAFNPLQAQVRRQRQTERRKKNNCNAGPSLRTHVFLIVA